MRGIVFIIDGGGGWQASIWGSLPWLPLGQRGTERKGKERQTGSCQGYGSREDNKSSGRVLPVLRRCVAAGGGPIAGTGWELARSSDLFIENEVSSLETGGRPVGMDRNAMAFPRQTERFLRSAECYQGRVQPELAQVTILSGLNLVYYLNSSLGFLAHLWLLSSWMKDTLTVCLFPVISSKQHSSWAAVYPPCVRIYCLSC